MAGGRQLDVYVDILPTPHFVLLIIIQMDIGVEKGGT